MINKVFYTIDKSYDIHLMCEVWFLVIPPFLYHRICTIELNFMVTSCLSWLSKMNIDVKARGLVIKVHLHCDLKFELSRQSWLYFVNCIGVHVKIKTLVAIYTSGEISWQ